MRFARWHGVALVVFGLFLNLARGDEAAPQEHLTAADNEDTHEELDATVWTATSGEYVACARQTYNLAAEALDLALRDKTWTASTEQFAGGKYQDFPPAIMVTLDESVWSLWPFQSRIIFDTGMFTYSGYVKWRNELCDPAVPGAQQFLQRAADKGVAIIYLCPCTEDLRDPIVRNIQRLNFPWGDNEQLLLGGAWPNHKKRDEIGKTHRILLIVSDYLGEFTQNTAGNAASRRQLAADNADFWGLLWFIIPNPMYGHWNDFTHGNRTARLQAQLAALDPGVEMDNKIDHAHEKLFSTLWIATSAEYYACARQAFSGAAAKLDLAVRDNTWTAAPEQFEQGGYWDLPPAVIVNLDETVWTNTPYEARRIELDEQYDVKSFDQWAQEAKCPAVAGAKEFLDYAVQQNVSIIYISSRGENLRDATLRNLQRLEFPYDPDQDQLLLGGNWADRNKHVQAAEKHRILLIVSDSLSDFLPDAEKDPEKRRGIAAQHANWWGLKWFIIPNPMYGIWEYRLFDEKTGLDRAGRIQAKLRALKQRMDAKPADKN